MSAAKFQPFEIDAQVDWKAMYSHLRCVTKFSVRRKIRRTMKDIRREAALERIIARQQLRAAELLEENRLLSESIETLRAERNDYKQKLDEAQARIDELESTLNDIVDAPYEDQPNDGNEWEKEYYLRGMHQ